MNPHQKPKSFQDNLKRRQRSHFVGREAQIELFRRNLERSPELWDYPIFNVWGQGGVGKSTLLRQFRKIAGEVGGLTAYTRESETSVPEVMARLADDLEQQGHRFHQFSDRYKVYRQKKQELESDPEAPQGFSAFLGKSIAKAGLGLAKQVPGSGAITPFLDEDTITTQASEWASYVAKKLTNKDEVLLVQEPVEVLTPLFLQDLEKVAQNTTLLLLFDTYEATTGFLDGWLRDLVDGRYGDLPLSLMIVIAGRDELDSNRWADYALAIARLSLNPFTEEEVKQYLNRQGITNPQRIELILRLSERLPVLVSMLASVNGSDTDEVVDPSETAVDRFLKWENDPTHRQVALDAALPRVLNRDVIAALHGQAGADELFDWLKQRSFVEERADGWAYHEVVRALMLRHKRRISRQGWAELHGKLAAHYKLQCQALELSEDQCWKDTDWQNYALQELYHCLCQSPQRHLSNALNQFSIALKNQRKFSERWAAVMIRVGKDAGADEVRRWGSRLSEGLLAYEEDRYDEAVAMFTALLGHTELETRGKAVVSAWRGETYRLMKCYDKAFQDLNRAIRLLQE